MPISVGYDYQPQGTVDLASLQMRKAQMDYERQQAAQQQMMAGLQAIAQIYQQRQEQQRQQQMLKDMGILKEEPIYKQSIELTKGSQQFAPGTPGWNAYAQKMGRQGVVMTGESGDINVPMQSYVNRNIPTGKTKLTPNWEAFDKLPQGAKFGEEFFKPIGLPGLSYEAPDQFAQLKAYLALKNAMDKGKPTAQSLRRMAQVEAAKRLGYSAMSGLSETQSKKYVKLQDELYSQYLKDYGIGEGEETNTNEELDNVIDTNW